MSTWAILIIGALGCYAIKLAGYFIPARWLESERANRVTTIMTVGLLGALIAMSTVGNGQGLRLDARLVAFAAAVVALKCKAPFLLVVIIGAAAAGLTRVLAGLI
jgi:fluoride ion exporter CrcB/FEX